MRAPFCDQTDLMMSAGRESRQSRTRNLEMRHAPRLSSFKRSRNDQVLLRYWILGVV